jgi:hypothetical protein
MLLSREKVGIIATGYTKSSIFNDRTEHAGI